MSILSLPNELLTYIAYQLPPWDMAALGQVNRRFRVIANDENYWKEILARTFPHHPPAINSKLAYAECMQRKNGRRITYSKNYLFGNTEYIGYDRLLERINFGLRIHFIKTDRMIDIEVQKASNLVDHTLAYVSNDKIYLFNFFNYRKTRVNFTLTTTIQKIILSKSILIIQEEFGEVTLLNLKNKAILKIRDFNPVSAIESHGKILLHNIYFVTRVYDCENLEHQFETDQYRLGDLFRDGIILGDHNYTFLSFYNGESILLNYIYLGQFRNHLIFKQNSNELIYWDIDQKMETEVFHLNSEIIGTVRDDTVPVGRFSHFDLVRRCVFASDRVLQHFGSVYVLSHPFHYADYDISKSEYIAHVSEVSQLLLQSFRDFAKYYQNTVRNFKQSNESEPVLATHKYFFKELCLGLKTRSCEGTFRKEFTKLQNMHDDCITLALRLSSKIYRIVNNPINLPHSTLAELKRTLRDEYPFLSR